MLKFSPTDIATTALRETQWCIIHRLTKLWFSSTIYSLWIHKIQKYSNA